MATRKGFTLIEVLIVVIILGILAAVVVPQFTQAADDGRANSTAILVRGIERKLSAEKAKTGVYPSSWQASWFEGGQLPVNPYFPTATTLVEVVSSDDLHPASKTGSATAAFWYNSKNGVVRARVPAGATDADSIATYNAANSCNITALNQVN